VYGAESKRLFCYLFFCVTGKNEKSLVVWGECCIFAHLNVKDMMNTKNFLMMMTMVASGMANAQTMGIKLENMDKSAMPGTDFYQYACGGWMEKKYERAAAGPETVGQYRQAPAFPRAPGRPGRPDRRNTGHAGGVH
jgi:hypothetical protein